MHQSFRTLAFATLALLGGLSGSARASEDDRDIIYRKNGTKVTGYVASETTANIEYRTIRIDTSGKGVVPKPNQMKLAEFDHVFYYGMESGAWKKGITEREAGNFETAAEFFNQLATTGSREWEKVYGSIAEGECWEMAHKYGDAAKAYGLVVSGFAGNPANNPPILPNRQWLDTKYHLGMAHAQNKDAANAGKVADELEAQGKKEGLSAAESRAFAIRAAMAAAEGNVSKFTEFMKKSSIRAFEEKEVWFHFKLYCAETYRTVFKKSKDAVSIYREILNGLGNDPARQAQIALGLGLTMAETDKQGALVELVKLDVMPYGSPDQKCEARYVAGRLLWDEAQAIKTNPEAMKDENRASFAKEMERSARLVISAAADGPAKNPNVELAKALLQSLGPDPEAPKEEKKAEEAPKEAPAADAAPKPAPKTPAKPAPKPK
jgi:hypothetical protein